MTTTRLSALFTLVVGLLLVAVPGAQTRLMSIDEVKPGMVGVGRTVFAGTQLEEFKVHILGVLRNVIAPNRDLILARLEGGPLAKTGVIAGMSGSPVYVDGRLIGAVSYALGQFATEPIAGITPIAEMTDATTMGAPAPSTRPVALSLPFKPSELFAVWSHDLGTSNPVALPGNAISGLAVSAGATLRPIAVPLMASGFEAGVLEPLAGAFSASGFLPVTGQSPMPTPVSTARPRTLAPGDAVGVALLSGDFELGATGTVTHVDGNRVFAFGHPLYNLGPTEFPMTTADVLVVLPSLMQSSKLASLGPVVGTLQQDRATAIAGRLGPGPQLIPMTVSLNSDRLGSRTFNFGVVRDTTFTPLLAYLAVANVLTAYERATGPASFTIRGTASIRAHDALEFEDVFTGDQPVGTAAAYIAGPLTQLFKNTSEPVDVERIALTIEASEEAAIGAHRARVAGHHPSARGHVRGGVGGPSWAEGRRDSEEGADHDSGESHRLGAVARRRRRSRRGRRPTGVARRRDAAALADHPDLQSRPSQQPPLRQALHQRCRCRRQRRAHGRTAAIGARRARVGSQHRQCLHLALGAPR